MAKFVEIRVNSVKKVFVNIEKISSVEIDRGQVTIDASGKSFTISDADWATVKNAILAGDECGIPGLING